MILILKRYLGNFKWGKPFEYVVDEDNLYQMNNDGAGSYRIYRKRGRPTTIYYSQRKADWEHYSKAVWRKGCYFFATDEEQMALWELAKKHGVITCQQPHAKIKWETYDPITGTWT